MSDNGRSNANVSSWDRADGGVIISVSGRIALYFRRSLDFVIGAGMGPKRTLRVGRVQTGSKTN